MVSGLKDYINIAIIAFITIGLLVFVLRLSICMSQTGSMVVVNCFLGLVVDFIIPTEAGVFQTFGGWGFIAYIIFNKLM